MEKQFGSHIKNLREQRSLLQREVASLLKIDTPLFSKIERGERIAKRGIVVHLSTILKIDKDKLITLWLADQVFDIINDEKLAEEVIQLVLKKLKSTKK